MVKFVEVCVGKEVVREGLWVGVMERIDIEEGEKVYKGQVLERIVSVLLINTSEFELSCKQGLFWCLQKSVVG